jgi:hypothetical protein
MKIEQVRWTEGAGWEPYPPGKSGNSFDLAILFGSPSVCKKSFLFEEISTAYPTAHRFGCSTAGEIFDTSVTEDALVVTAVQFEKSRCRGAKVRLSAMEESFAVGQELAGQLEPAGLVHVLVLSEGLHVNGSELVKGLEDRLPEGVSVTGGLSGDGDRFQETFICWDGGPVTDHIAAVGLYGDSLKIGYGSYGGWDSFGPERLITRAKGNILYEFDGKSALDLYKQYLGEHAAGLPATGLLFPLELHLKDSERGIVRTILAVDENDRSMIFAGNIPEGVYARLMKANFDRLVDGSCEAARSNLEMQGQESPELAILISCVGRKLILRQRVEEEIEVVRDILGGRAVMTGFYSYGEIAPFSRAGRCELHNQTMTVTTISE